MREQLHQIAAAFASELIVNTFLCFCFVLLAGWFSKKWFLYVALAGLELTL